MAVVFPFVRYMPGFAVPTVITVAPDTVVPAEFAKVSVVVPAPETMVVAKWSLVATLGGVEGTYGGNDTLSIIGEPKSSKVRSVMVSLGLLTPMSVKLAPVRP